VEIQSELTDIEEDQEAHNSQNNSRGLLVETTNFPSFTLAQVLENLMERERNLEESKQT
jgi:hypothetical protein